MIALPTGGTWYLIGALLILAGLVYTMWSETFPSPPDHSFTLNDGSVHDVCDYWYEAGAASGYCNRPRSDHRD